MRTATRSPSAGPSQDTVTDTVTGIPGLVRSALDRAACSAARRKTHSRSELIMFMTPHVIFDETNLIEASDELKARVKMLRKDREAICNLAMLRPKVSPSQLRCRNSPFEPEISPFADAGLTCRCHACSNMDAESARSGSVSDGRNCNFLLDLDSLRVVSITDCVQGVTDKAVFRRHS